MNFLAHAHLAFGDEDLLVGQMLGDFLEPGWRERLPARVIEGVDLHHQVDRFTDAHDIFLQSRRRLGPRFRLYSGVLVDVFYDHFLARSWERYHPQTPLPEFTRRTYRALEHRQSDWTQRFRRVFPSMAAHDWLASYARLDAVDRALEGISRRLSRPNPLAEGGAALRDAFDELESDFHTFFPALEAFTRARIDEKD